MHALVCICTFAKKRFRSFFPKKRESEREREVIKKRVDFKYREMSLFSMRPDDQGVICDSTFIFLFFVVHLSLSSTSRGYFRFDSHIQLVKSFSGKG